MDIDLYSDPSCPWCWTASEWLHAAATDRELTLRVRPFSLALLDKPAPPSVSLARTWGLRALRVATSLDDRHATAFLGEFSRALFDATRETREPDLGDVLELVGCQRGLAFRADESWRDDAIRASMKAAAELRGLPLDDTTTIPILVLHSASGPVAVDGPLVDPAPGPSDAGALWDAFALLAGAEEMFGATRPRRGPHSSVAALAGAALIEGKMS